MGPNAAEYISICIMSSNSIFLPATNDYGLFFVFCACALGIIARLLQRNGLFTFQRSFTIPYAVVILALGFLVGILDNYVDVGPLSFTISTWRNIGGHALGKRLF